MELAREHASGTVVNFKEPAKPKRLGTLTAGNLAIQDAKLRKDSHVLVCSGMCRLDESNCHGLSHAGAWHASVATLARTAGTPSHHIASSGTSNVLILFVLSGHSNGSSCAPRRTAADSGTAWLTAPKPSHCLRMRAKLLVHKAHLVYCSCLQILGRVFTWTRTMATSCAHSRVCVTQFC